MKTINALFASLVMLAASALAATPSGIVVEGVQPPAWIEHVSGAREPLAIGMPLANKDKVYTGPDARALLRLADGSLVKLGENGLLEFDDVGQKRSQARDVVTATLDVVSGAFRFTTGVINRFRGERDYKVRIATITAGIRGTDVWAKADKTSDIVCLIEGSITVTHDQDALTLDQPMSFYIAPRNAPALPVARVSQQQFEDWARQTDIRPGAGAMHRGGAWRVTVAEADNQGDAFAIYDRLRGAGYPAEIRPVKRATGNVYQLQISNLQSKQEAEALAGKLTRTLAIASPKISK